MNEKTSNQFKRFAEQECRDSSPLYYALALEIAEDEVLVELASHARAGQPVPNLFFAAVQYLLASHPSHALSGFYPPFCAEVRPRDECFPVFKDFAQANRQAVIELLQSRLVQTNEVRRCAYLYPAFLLAAHRFNSRPLSLVEIGTSAGLNLLWDRFAYSYDGSNCYGDKESEVRITSSFRGAPPECLALRMPSIARRIGIDLNVIDLPVEDEANWLRALIWPEHQDRRERLEGAIAVRKETQLDLRIGDGFLMIEAIADGVPADSVLCVYHTHVANQVTAQVRADFLRFIDHLGQQRDLIHFLTISTRPCT